MTNGMTRTCRFALLAALFATPAPGQQPPPGSDGAALSRALDSVRADRIVADVFFVACDDMGGRDTPSTGQRLAARFVKNRLQRLGWKPGARDGWLQTYPLAYKRVKEPDTRAAIQRGDGTGERIELEFGRDYYFSVRDLETFDGNAGVVFCGAGTQEELAAAAPALKGRFALCLDGGDDGRAVEEALRAAGAIGALFMEPPRSSGRSYVQDFGPRLGFLRTGRAAWPAEPDPRQAPFFPRAYLPNETVARMMALVGTAPLAAGQELPIRFIDTRRVVGDGKVYCENVCGWWPGSDPALGKQVILVSAHYDHVGTAADGTVYNGADDNGSGTCGLLALAEALVFEGPLRRSVMLIWVSGEEKGLYGSKAWTSAPWLPDDARPVADINIDMIGRNAPHQILVTPSHDHASYNGLTKMVERLAPEEGFTTIGSADAYYTRSDQVNFARLGIPVTFLFSDVHADYHKPSDDPEKIDGDKIRRVVRLVLRMLNEMQGDSLDLGK